MSLHLGNLSSRIRRDELLHVFERFGQCTLQVKDKFGFVVYQYHANAEEALRTLRGQKICGEKVTLAWSNRQPRVLQRHSKDGKTFESPRGRQQGREYYSNKKLGSGSQDDERRGFKEVNRSNGRVESSEVIAEATGHQINNRGGYFGDKRQDFAQDLPDEGGGLEANLLENDRWGEQVARTELESGLNFDRYEPYHGDCGKVQEDILTSNHLESSSHERVAQEKHKTNQIVQPAVKGFHNSKSQKSCYLCGEVGHGVYNCPRELKNLSPRSEGQLFLDRDASSTGKPKFHRKASRDQQKLRGHVDPPGERVRHRVRKREDRGNKQSRIYNTSPERHESKKARILVSSSIHSNYTASRSQSRSRSVISIPGSHSHSSSRSVPSEINFMHSRSRSAPIPSDPRSGKLKLRSISRSGSPTSLGQPLLSSPSRVQINQQDPLMSHSDLKFKENSDLVEPVLKSDALSDNSKLGVVKTSIKNGIAPLSVEENITDSHSLRRDDVGNYSIACDIYQTEESCIPLSDDSGHNSGSLSRTREFKRNDLVGDGKSMLVQNSGIEASGRHHAANVMNISYKELCMVLKNSGLEHPHVDEKDLPPEIYFGSARLWPWEVIYYRRLKKGPISKENYARRLAQNEEFGIVDKYIRSSSSWGEMTDENP